METFTVNASVPFVIGRHFDTRVAVVKQDADAAAGLPAGTLLASDSGKLVPCDGSTTFPICALLSDITKEALKAGDVSATVVYNAILNKAFVEAANAGLTINEAFIWESIANGIDIKEMI